jgi:hypothetical protein
MDAVDRSPTETRLFLSHSPPTRESPLAVKEGLRLTNATFRSYLPCLPISNSP